METQQSPYAQVQQQLTQLEISAKKKMTREAISRYGAIKLSHPEVAVQAIFIVGQAVQQGMKEIIDDEKFKEILREIQKAKIK